MTLLILILLIILWFDIGLLTLWGSDVLQFTVVFVLHSVVSSLLLIIFALRRTEGLWLALLAFPIVMALGPIGVAGLLFSGMLYRWYRKTATPFEVWYSEILPFQATSQTERLIERLRVWSQAPAGENQQSVLVHFIDIMKSGSREEKQTAIDLMRNNYHSDFSSVLKDALGDSCNIVRSHAVAAITRIEESFQAEAYRLERLKQESPDDLNNILMLARHYDNYANSGLGDTDLLMEYRHKAEALYRHSLEFDSDNISTLWSLGRLLIRDKRIEDAIVVIEKALMLSNDVAEPMQRIWYWECLYNLHRFATLRAEIRHHGHELVNNADLPKSLQDSIALWADHDGRIEAVAQ